MTPADRRRTVAESAPIPLTACGTPSPQVLRVTQEAPQRRDVRYDSRAEQAALPVEIHYSDGTALEALLILTPGQVELFRIKLDQAIAQRRESGR
ncbi:hypothetical protein [Streptacidiphilus sp. P02-A3a]|uniref:hypothetical protein n=1 Tax=Streptacidiphilus sp. P02-A3a TaxID=2704468 RepID=UPI001CDD64F9|nr:hypothetical protein [Streptacidiphilus sp. P02-A3a]